MTSGLQAARSAGADHVSDMVRSVPACATLGVRGGGPGGRPGCRMDGRLPAAGAADGGLSRGAALILADQGLAAGVFATLPEPMAMMTLDLRLDCADQEPAPGPEAALAWARWAAPPTPARRPDDMPGAPHPT